MADLAEKILDAIGAAEDGVPPLHIEGRYLGPRTEAERAVLRRCVADREMVELHKRGHNAGCAVCDGDDYVSSTPVYPCQTLILLARGYGIQP